MHVVAIDGAITFFLSILFLMKIVVAFPVYKRKISFQTDSTSIMIWVGYSFAFYRVSRIFLTHNLLPASVLHTRKQNQNILSDIVFVCFVLIRFCFWK